MQNATAATYAYDAQGQVAEEYVTFGEFTWRLVPIFVLNPGNEATGIAGAGANRS
jgi:hypothetical protein